MICAKRPRLIVAGLPRQKGLRLRRFLIRKSEVKKKKKNVIYLEACPQK